MMGHVKELTLRVRANEKVVAIVSAVGIGAGGIVGTTAFAPKADAHMGHSLPTGEWIQRVREHESKRNRTPIDEMINSSLEEIKNGCNDSTEQKVLLQFQSYQDQESRGWRYDRCGNRSWIRLSEDGESEDCWHRHTREEDTRLGGEGTWVRCNQLDETEIGGDN